ncbi:MAG: tripartite tricarboxylate transporter TctB family protein [Pseudomonadota bacterium]
MTLNRDTIVAIVLLLICGGLMAASFQIREPDYGQLSPAAWPRAIVVAMTLLSAIYLVQSLRAGPDQETDEGTKTWGEFFAHWQNVIYVFALFLGYLLIIPWLGMLIGGTLFVFLVLTALGEIRNTLLHLAIAVVSIGGIWLLFTHALGVLLPRGDLTGF